MPQHATDLTDKKFGRLTVLFRNGSTVHGAALWRVSCVCGVEKDCRTDLLTRGLAVSCGCYRSEASAQRVRTHGMTGTFEFRVWTAMRNRCLDPKHPRYYRYGGRGIAICKRWTKFENFFADMGLCPFEKGSIERKNNDKGYTPSNCIWLPKNQQSKNRTFNRKRD